MACDKGAVSPLDSGEQRYVKVIVITIITIIIITIIIITIIIQDNTAMGYKMSTTPAPSSP